MTKRTPLRIAVIGCVGSTRATLEALFDLPSQRARVVGLMTRHASSFNADFEDLTPLAIAQRCPVFHVDNLPGDAAQAAWMRETEPDLILCVGWSRLLSPELLAVAPDAVIGYHPAALPANRGRHPLIWALALGLDATASTFFVMDDRPDNGPLVSQVDLPITPGDDAATLYAKMLGVIPGQISTIVDGLIAGTLVRFPQDASAASSWRKRSAADGLIDWRMSARTIHNLVRALARPYPGATFTAREGAAKAWRSEISAAAPANVEPGKVLAHDGHTFIAKCGEGSIRIVEHDLVDLPAVGTYL